MRRVPPTVIRIRPSLRALLAACLLCTAGWAAAQPPDRVAFPGSIREIPAAAAGRHAAAVSRLTLRTEERSAGTSFEVALRMRSFGELQARIERGERIAPAEMAAKYFPLAADHERLVAWLRAQGLEVTRTDANRVAIFGRGSVDAVANAFQVTFARVSAPGGEYTSAITAPSLPSDLAPMVLGIHGLQPHILRRPLSLPGKPQPRLTVSLGGYTPSQIAKAYNADGISATGAGETIAVYALAFPKDSDLTTFWTDVGVNQSLANVQTVSVAGGPAASPSSGASEEVTLDTEWASALAPGAKLRIYGVNENDPGENDEVLQQVYADLPSEPAMHQLCICIGGNEEEVERDYLIIEAQYMANLASAGVSVLVASGDTGAYADNVLQVTYPTSDPDVTGVGGTTLTISDGAVTSEVAWTGSGGGVSAVFSRPSWQTGAGVPTGTMRLVPDVSAAADQNQGALIIYNGSQMEIGGTSWAAPIWTAFCALLNQGRTAPLGLLNPSLYPLIGTSSLRDITTGQNGYYSAGPGYDPCTGIGVPEVSALLQDPLNTAAQVSIPAQLGDQTVTVGQPATFFVVGAGAASLSYQWQGLPSGASQFVNLSDNGTYGGSTTPMLVVSGTTLGMTNEKFQCVVSGAPGGATSTPAATLRVNSVGATTLAGWPGSAGSADGTGRAARFAYPGSVRTDAAGNIYVADSYNNTVRKVTPAGVATTVAGTPRVSGSTDGPAATALFNGTAGVAVDSSGNLFVADDGNMTIREISASGVVKTLAGVAGSKGETDGTGPAARFYDPQNLAIDGSGNLYVADGKGNSIRKVTPAGVVTTLAGSLTAGSADGTGGAAQFNNPTGIAVDGSGNVYVADNGNDTIRMITPAGVVTTLAGTPQNSGSADGTGASASFDGPSGVGVDSSGNIYVADSNNDTIRMVGPGGVVTTVAGSPGAAEDIDGIASSARFEAPGDVTVDSSGVIYVADSGNDTVRRIIAGTVAAAPTITAQPAGRTVNEGASVTLSMGIAGTAPFSFQWYLNGAAIAGATGPAYGIANVQQADVGGYSVAISNAEGSVTSSSAAVAVTVPPGFPDITAGPQGATLANGGSVLLSVTVTGDGPFAYQWMLNGAPIAGANGSTYSASAPGSYTVSVSNSLGSATSLAASVAAGSRLVNVSSRALVGTGGAITIAGFVIEGPQGSSKQVLIRGVGPALSSFGVDGVLAQPSISVSDSSGAVVASNTGWGSNPASADVAAATSHLGAFALEPGSADSALLASLAPGAYSVELTGVGSTTGVGLVEVYETDRSDQAILVNLSTRAQVGTGAGILIAGFVVQGTQPATVLVRGVGPALGGFGVSGFLTAPVLTVLDSNDVQVATNEGWGSAPNTPALITSAAATAGAFPLAAGSADSALLLTLQPGAYTAQVTGANGATGIALVEVYQVPP